MAQGPGIIFLMPLLFLVVFELRSQLIPFLWSLRSVDPSVINCTENMRLG